MNQPQIQGALSRIQQHPVADLTKGTKIRSVHRQSASKWLLGIPLLFSRKLNVWDAQRGCHVYTSVSKSDWKKVKQAASDENALANMPKKSLQIRKKLALNIIRKTGQAEGLSVLDRASPQQLCVIARQLARYGHDTNYRNSIFDELRKAQNQWQALSMDPQTLKMVDSFVNGDQKFGNSSVPTVSYKKQEKPQVNYANTSLKFDVHKEIKEKAPDAFRNLVADLISVDERDRDQKGDDPARLDRLRDVFRKHRSTTRLLDTTFARDLMPDLAKSCGVEPRLIETIRAIELELSGKNNADVFQPDFNRISGTFNELAEALDDSIATYRTYTLPDIGEQLSQNIPQKEGNFGKFLNEVFVQYFQSMDDNDVRAVMSSSLREATVKDPAERHLVATLKGSGPYMLKILQLMGDSVDVSTGDGAKLKKALGELKDQLLPISPEIQTSMLRELVDNSNPRITSIVDVKPLGAASVGQTFLATLNFESGLQKSVVIKLLKPGVDQRAARERTWMDTIAQKYSGIQETFSGIADQIDRELDLTREAENVGKAKVYRQSGMATLQSVRNVSGMDATQEHMFMELAPGRTVKAQLEELKSSLNVLQLEKQESKQLDLETRLACKDTYADAKVLSERLHGLAGVWLKEALFGSGFYHGDLHGGNMMLETNIPDAPLTLIDFGNASTLTRTERSNILKLIMASEFKYPEIFVETLAKLLGPQSQALLNQQETKNKLIAQFTRLCHDNALSGSQRMLEAFNVANTLDIAIPNVISNFARSQNMLEMAINDVNKLLQTSYAALEADENPPENPIQPMPLSKTLKDTLLASKKQILLLTSQEGWAMRNENTLLPAAELL